MAVIAARPLSDPAAKLGLVTRDHTPALALQYERLVLARRSINIPTNCPRRAVGRSDRREEVVLTVAGVWGCRNGQSPARMDDVSSDSYELPLAKVFR